MLIGKKGVSPLIATVLLVMIVVSIGAAVMVVFQGLTEDSISNIQAQQQLIKCGSDVSVGIITVGDSYRICVNPTSGAIGNMSLYIYMENKGLKDISGWRFTVIGEEGVYDSSDQGSALTKGLIKAYSFTFNGTGDTVADLSKIRLSPQITGGPSNPVVTCTAPNLEWDSDQIVEFDLCNDTSWDNNI